MKNILLGLLASLTILLIGYMLIKLDKLESSDRPVMVQETKKTRFDVVYSCQQLSSQATNDKWSYKSCLEELEKTIEPEVKIRT